MIFSIARAFQGADSSAKVERQMRAREILAVIGNEAFERKIDLANQHSASEFIDHAPHFRDEVMDLSLIGGVRGRNC